MAPLSARCSSALTVQSPDPPIIFVLGPEQLPPRLLLARRRHGEDETVAVEDVKWLFEEQSRDGCIIISPSWEIPVKGTKADKNTQPPHRQAAAHHQRVVAARGGEFRVTMETPSRIKPKPFRIDITAAGAAVALIAATSVAAAAAATPKAG